MDGRYPFPGDLERWSSSIRVAVKDMTSLLPHRLKAQTQQHLLHRLEVYNWKPSHTVT